MNYDTPRIKQTIPARAAAYVAIYPMLAQIAKEHGYALAVHGSAHRDLDLIAVPWIEEASEPLALVQAFKEALSAVTHADHSDEHFPDCDPKNKPHGRIAYSLHFTNQGMYGGYIDLSVLPISKGKEAACT